MTEELISPGGIVAYALVGGVLPLVAWWLEWLARTRPGAEIWAHQLSVLVSAAGAAAVAVGVLAQVFD